MDKEWEVQVWRTSVNGWNSIALPIPTKAAADTLVGTYTCLGILARAVEIIPNPDYEGAEDENAA